MAKPRHYNSNERVRRITALLYAAQALALASGHLLIQSDADQASKFDPEWIGDHCEIQSLPKMLGTDLLGAKQESKNIDRLCCKYYTLVQSNLLKKIFMKNPENKQFKNPLKRKDETKISDSIKLGLPKLHLKLLKKFKGKHGLVNSFIYIPDIVNGDDFDVIKAINKSTQNANQLMTTKNIKYDLIGFSFNKLMQLKFEYLVEDEESGMCTTAWLLEKSEGWVVNKIESYWNIS